MLSFGVIGLNLWTIATGAATAANGRLPSRRQTVDPAIRFMS
jgi:hypothetical protein